MGPYAGQWHWLHSIASDPKGNIYTAESRGNQLQKFIYKGRTPTPGKEDAARSNTNTTELLRT
jgi:hypothetical protein